MDNNKDKKYVMDTMNELKIYNDKIKECLSAIALVMVDDNNSRLKDESFKNELDSLLKQINSMSTSIDTIQTNLR